jgi:hypothetical protein
MKSVTFSSILIVLSTLVLSSPNVAQQTLKPTDNCRDHSASAIINWPISFHLYK